MEPPFRRRAGGHCSPALPLGSQELLTRPGPDPGPGLRPGPSPGLRPGPSPHSGGAGGGASSSYGNTRTRSGKSYESSCYVLLLCRFRQIFPAFAAMKLGVTLRKELPPRSLILKSNTPITVRYWHSKRSVANLLCMLLARYARGGQRGLMFSPGAVELTISGRHLMLMSIFRNASDWARYRNAKRAERPRKIRSTLRVTSEVPKRNMPGIYPVSGIWPRGFPPRWWSRSRRGWNWVPGSPDSGLAAGEMAGSRSGHTAVIVPGSASEIPAVSRTASWCVATYSPREAFGEVAGERSAPGRRRNDLHHQS
jgi:hypothetical protein